MRDRLRAVQCPSEMMDQIDGYSKRSVRESYLEDCGFEGLLSFMLIAMKMRLYLVALLAYFLHNTTVLYASVIGDTGTSWSLAFRCVKWFPIL